MVSLAPAQNPSQHLNLQSTMAPHFTEQSASRQDEDDDLEIARIVTDEHGALDFMSRSLEPGEKADDAVDYEDIGDDDLAEEVDSPTADGGENNSWLGGESDGEEGDGALREGDIQHKGKTGHAADFDDLFGDFTSSTGLGDGINGNEAEVPDDEDFPFDIETDDNLQESSSTLPASGQAGESASSGNALFRDIDFGAKESDRFFDHHDLNIPPPPPENSAELVASLWPDFQPDRRLRVATLFWYKKAYFVGKTPLRVPKPVIPTKISLELEPDQEKAFKINSTAGLGKRASQTDTSQKSIIFVERDGQRESNSDDDIDMDTGLEDNTIGGISWTDLEVICDDWDSKVGKEISDSEPEENGKHAREDDLFGDDKWEEEVGITPVKKQKIVAESTAESYAPHVFALPSFDDPEEATAKIARSVILDLNDPHLLLDFHQPGGASLRQQDSSGAAKPLSGGASLKDRLKRYNISNDEAYDMLKENHGKVRSTIGNLRVEHGLPALRLQYPYYKTKLGVREARSFHRPVLSFRPNEMIRFKKPSFMKRKHLKGRSPESLFSTTKDLSLADNSHVLLLEYSEEYPTMLSNFGMHNRIINYYRRKNWEDTARPKLDLGETAVLLPQDRSPFSIFGAIEPGQVTPALYNAMFKAPIFKQQSKPTDFLVIRNTTGVNGSNWYLRNIENLYVVGQEFPSVEVPGPHSRKVTTASKNRMKMIAFRKVRRSATHSVPIADVTAHFPETTDMQNRQKLKEFMVFSKASKEWEMRSGEAIPDEQTLRTMIEPEDVCLLESMQVGVRQLADAGYGEGAAVNSDDEEKEGQSIQQQLAPWETTKNFLNAAQGKAMLEVHGEGDPSGRGWAFSFVKVSMKGGFKSVGESVEDKLDSKRKAELGGHSYNVALQQKAYEESISKVWEEQTKSLSSQIEPSEAEPEDAHGDDTGDVFESEAPTPAAWTHRGDDETTSQFSRISASSSRGKVLRITRRLPNKFGILETTREIVRDPRVIRQYLKRRRDVESERVQVSSLPDKPTGKAEQDRAAKKRLEEELFRLSRNKERRIAREKAKGIVPDGTATSDIGSPTSGTPKISGTKRKCANCGQVGHIKTNKKACPMLNGTMRPEDGLASNTAGFGSMGTAPAL